MAKAKTSRQRGESLRTTSKSKPFNLDKFEVVTLKKGAPIKAYDPKATLRDSRFVGAALIEALIEGDVEAFKEILKAHVETLGKDFVAARSGVSRSTVFRMLEPGSNPTLNNVAKVFRALKAG